MAHLTDIRIQGLGGSSEERQFSLTPEVNVIFGDNGGGKTTLLRAVHSALINDASILDDSPVSAASITFFTKHYNTSINRVLEKVSTEKPEQWDLNFATVGQQPEPVNLSKWSWLCSTDVPGSTDVYSSHFLPVSRLYQAALERRFRGFYSSPENIRGNDDAAKNETSLEATFVANFNKRWSEFSNSLLADVQNIQQEGIASILQTVMLHRPGQDTSPPGDPNAAYDLAKTFFDRRPELRALLQKKHEFVNLYQGNPALRAVIRNIESVEQKILAAQWQRNFLNESLNSLFRGKSILMGDAGISVIDKWGNRLRLENLSTGEKQVLILFLEVLSVGKGILIIDEPEISLHIAWQRRILQTLHLLNPEAQIIAATHSPEIMADLNNESIFRI